MKRFDAVLVELERLVVNGADEVFVGLGADVEHGSRAREFLGLCKHERGEFLAGELAGAVKNGAVEILVEGDLAGIEGRKRKVVAVVKLLPIELESFDGLFAGVAVPTVGEDDAADVPEKCGDVRH